jgi:hypothetical protein
MGSLRLRKGNDYSFAFAGGCPLCQKQMLLVLRDNLDALNCAQRNEVLPGGNLNGQAVLIYLKIAKFHTVSFIER